MPCGSKLLQCWSKIDQLLILFLSAGTVILIGAGSNMREQFKSIDQYIKSAPLDVQPLLANMRQTIHKAAPAAEEAVRYGMPTFRLNNKNLVHFAALKNHIGFYPTPSGITAFEKELKGFISTKGAVQFPLGKPIPYHLVSRITAFRVGEVIKQTE